MKQVKALLNEAKFSDFYNNNIANTFEFYFIAPKELLDEYGFDVTDETVSSSIKIEVSKDFTECSVCLSPTEYFDNVLTDTDWNNISLELELIEVLVDVACQTRKLSVDELGFVHEYVDNSCKIINGESGESPKKLNTMEAFEKNEFYIERDGAIFKLTPKEMSDFMYLRKAIIGKHRLENYLKNHPEQKKIISQIMKNQDSCYELENLISVRPGDDEFMDELYINDLIDRTRKVGDLDE